MLRWVLVGVLVDALVDFGRCFGDIVCERALRAEDPFKVR